MQQLTHAAIQALGGKNRLPGCCFFLAFHPPQRVTDLLVPFVEYDARPLGLQHLAQAQPKAKAKATKQRTKRTNDGMNIERTNERTNGIY